MTIRTVAVTLALLAVVATGCSSDPDGSTSPSSTPGTPTMDTPGPDATGPGAADPGPDAVPLAPGRHTAQLRRPLDYTTTEAMRRLGPYPLVLSPEGVNGRLVIAQPERVNGLSTLITADDFDPSSPPVIPSAQLVPVPTDIGAWLGAAVGLRVTEEGAATIGGYESRWWQVEVSDPDAACVPGGFAPPCVWLWEDADGTGAGDGVVEGDLTRIYAIPADDVLTLAVLGARAEDPGAAAWLKTGADILATVTFEQPLQ